MKGGKVIKNELMFNNVSRLTACREVVRSFRISAYAWIAAQLGPPPLQHRGVFQSVFGRISFANPWEVIALRSDGVPENLVDVTGVETAPHPCHGCALPAELTAETSV